MARTGSPKTATTLGRYATFTEALVAAAKGRTQFEIASELGVSQSRVSRWITGDSLPDAAVVPALARLMAVEETELVLFLYAMRLDSDQTRSGAELYRRYSTLIEAMRTEIAAMGRRIDDLEARQAGRGSTRTRKTPPR